MTKFEEEKYRVSLQALQEAFPGRLLVELSVAGPLVGVGRTTWHRHNSEGHPPFPARRIGNKRYVHIMDMAKFAAGIDLSEPAPASPLVIAPVLPAATDAPRPRGKPGRPRKEAAAVQAAGLASNDFTTRGER